MYKRWLVLSVALGLMCGTSWATDKPVKKDAPSKPAVQPAVKVSPAVEAARKRAAVAKEQIAKKKAEAEAASREAEQLNRIRRPNRLSLRKQCARRWKPP